MHIVHVFVHVKPGTADDFIRATLLNARASVTTEPGCLRFDVLRRQDYPSRFVLVEVYRTPEDAASHKQTPHYTAWRDSVGPMMAEARTSVTFSNVFPDSEQGWKCVV